MRPLLEKKNPILRQKAEPVDPAEIGAPWLKDLIAELFEVMKEQGAVGVAAPQIGVSKRVIVFSSAYTKRRKIEKNIPDTALINPTIRILTDEKERGFEGCLNCGELRGEVARFYEIEYSGLDEQGNLVNKKATDLEARILQHEVDHLDGILFLDRVADPKNIMTLEELQKLVSQTNKQA
ncbi:polypeptide deformylase [Legionella adelaidensis]|uniref:Peptide deformylase n=1 Tax=Legionella adelaidensis TaxID=45056 RepID=A0A0W0R0W5_9GAMM|nr:peptide deformylase [Legionella adelaidensis]KTC64737.1 polypeptide deformylase [Legionella adelaidensis]